MKSFSIVSLLFALSAMSSPAASPGNHRNVTTTSAPETSTTIPPQTVTLPATILTTLHSTISSCSKGPCPVATLTVPKSPTPCTTTFTVTKPTTITIVDVAFVCPTTGVFTHTFMSPVVTPETPTITLTATQTVTHMSIVTFCPEPTTIVHSNTTVVVPTPGTVTFVVITTIPCLPPVITRSHSTPRPLPTFCNVSRATTSVNLVVASTVPIPKNSSVPIPVIQPNATPTTLPIFKGIAAKIDLSKIGLGLITFAFAILA
ncbi:hypothetical protein NEOLI_002236 [Neolecta irregularis DAH-3]|uniref:Uncharacterized protein n=1 Tax=Neolecta irregularis (strain DAH-3) TaxID=1198029 RepID=A0A1U7LRC0_NEOID|nr:hypothetical protein NEOLI_002236 [Neolecta irregularis DAH-3]|eukprot:OLL25220.1 hypothetical protein NEOLI_002236 [Neolecta irregularis DAH-3]